MVVFIVFLISSAEGAITMFSMIDQQEAFDVLFDFLSWRQVINDHCGRMVTQYEYK